METLSLEQVKAYQGEYKFVTICLIMYADVRTPIEVLRIVKNISSHCYLLESMEDSQRWSPDPYGPSGTAYFPDTGRQ